MPRLPDLVGKRVLDLACGTGRWLQTLMRYGARIGMGVDISEDMLRVAANKPSLRKKLLQADCLRLPFSKAVFDFVVCSFAIGHVRHIGIMLCELGRVMDQGGALFISDLHPAAYASGWRTGFRDHHGVAQIETCTHSVKELVSESRKAGFTIRSHDELCIGAEEKPIFVRAGKAELFEQVVEKPAISILELTLGKSTHVC